MQESQIRRLAEAAKLASEKAYSPYSGFRVGAAVLTKDGHIYSGCNIENASYSLTICAERVALFSAIADGHDEIAALALYANSAKPTPPCGACRQVIRELARGALIIMASGKGELTARREEELLPESFDAANLENEAPALGTGHEQG